MLKVTFPSCVLSLSTDCVMAAPVKLRVIMGENNCQRLFLPDGIPQSISELSQEIKAQCGIEGHFRLQFMDAEFGNEFNNLLTMSDVQDKGTIKIIFNSDVPGQSGGSAPGPLIPPSASVSSHPPDNSSSL